MQALQRVARAPVYSGAAISRLRRSSIAMSASFSVFYSGICYLLAIQCEAW